MNRPYIKPVHIVAEFIGIITTVVALLYSVIKAAMTEGEIATHYDFSGNVDGYGSPWVMIILPIIMLVTMIIMVLSLHLASPGAWNFPFKVNPERAVLVYSDATMAIALMEAEIGIYTLAMSMTFTDGKVAFPLSMILVAALAVSTTVCIVKAAKDNRQ